MDIWFCLNKIEFFGIYKILFEKRLISFNGYFGSSNIAPIA